MLTFSGANLFVPFNFITYIFENLIFTRKNMPRTIVHSAMDVFCLNAFVFGNFLLPITGSASSSCGTQCGSANMQSSRATV